MRLDPIETQVTQVNGLPIFLQAIDIPASATYTAIYPNTTAIPSWSGQSQGFDPLPTGAVIMLQSDTDCQVLFGSAVSSGISVTNSFWLQAGIPFVYHMRSSAPGVTLLARNGSASGHVMVFTLV